MSRGTLQIKMTFVMNILRPVRAICVNLMIVLNVNIKGINSNFYGIERPTFRRNKSVGFH